MCYLWCNFLSHSCKLGRSIDILLVTDMWDIFDINNRLPMNEAVQDTFLKSWQVIGDLMTLAHTEGVVAVREKNGLELTLVVQEVALVDVSQLDFVLMPSIAEKISSVIK